MPTQAVKVTALISTGNWTQISTLQGRVTCAIYAVAACDIVTNAVDATAAVAENTAGRVFQVPAGTFPQLVDLDPCKTWVRSGGAQTNIHFLFNW